MVLFNTMGPIPDDSLADAEERARKVGERHRAALTIVRAALHRHRVKDLAAVSERRRQVILGEIKRALEALDLTKEGTDA